MPDGPDCLAMDAYKAIVTKRDARAYSPDPVDEESLRRVLQAARMAGSAKNAQLTRLVVARDPEVRKRLAACGDFTAWIPSAPIVLVFALPTEGGRIFDVGRMAQNAMVAANALGLATCPVTFQHQDRIREALGLPDDHEGPMGVTLGHAAPTGPGAPRMSAPRVPIRDLVHLDRWGQPLPSD